MIDEREGFVDDGEMPGAGSFGEDAMHGPGGVEMDCGLDGGSDWRADITDERVRAFSERFSGPADAAKAAFELRQKLGRSVPAPGADGAESEAFRNAIGVPASSSDYETRFPDDLPPQIADALHSPDGGERLDRFLEVAHEAGFTQSQLDAALNWYGHELASADGAVTGHQRRETEMAVADLRSELGGDFDRTLTTAARATAAFGDEDFLNLLDTAQIGGIRLGNHPAFVRTMAAVGARMGEAAPLVGGGGMRSSDLDARHAALTSKMNDALDAGDHALANRLDHERTQISRQLVGAAPIVGEGARVL